MSGRAYDVIIAGGGIVGTACAAALSREGLKVIVVEPREIGAGATAAGMGHILVLEESEPEFALTRYARELWRKAQPELPREAAWQDLGTLWVAVNEADQALVARKAQLLASHGIETELLDSQALRESEPNLREGILCGLLVPGDSVLDAKVAARWLAGQAEANGAEIRRGLRVIEWRQGEALLGDGSSLPARWLINATGADATYLSRDAPVRRRKGHVAVTEPAPGLVFHDLIEIGYLASTQSWERLSIAFNVQPRSGGHVLIGSSRQYDAAGVDVEPAVLARMLEHAYTFVPRLAEAEVVRSWAGFRAATPDGLPLIGPSPTQPGLYLATGHEGLGITTALATAELIAAQLLRRSAPIPIAPYLPERFTNETVVHTMM
jgi:D-hydroxyproline dehydrogenase subunit beta